MKYVKWFVLLVLAAAIWVCPAGALTQDELKSELRATLIAQSGSLANSVVPSGMLYDLTVPLAPISMLNGTESCRAATLNEWLQVCHELHRAALDSLSLPWPQMFRDLAHVEASEHIHSVAILNYDFQRVRAGWSADSVLNEQDGHIVAVNPGGLETRHVFAAAVLNQRTYRGSAVQFRFDARGLCFTNGAALAKLLVDFDDGLGLRSVPLDGEVLVHYSSVGSKMIELRAKMSDSAEQVARLSFEVMALMTPNPTETWNLQAGQPYNGAAGTGEAYVYLAPNHNTVTKPIVVPEGLDLDNSMYWDELYAMLNQQNLLEDLRSLGYDAIVLNYDSATTYVQRNAYLIETLLDSVHARVGGTQTYVMVGPSMGGLTSRYALLHMEQNNHPHYIRSLISFDAPQKGGNIPLGLQYWVDFFASQSTDAAYLRDVLNSAAARQLLVTHLTSPASGTASPDPMRASLLSELASLGNYPAQPRLVAIANGSGFMQNQGYNPGAQLIQYHYSSLFLNITGDAWALHNTQSQQIFNGYTRIWPLPATQQAVTVGATWPWDNAPGGIRNSMAEMDSVPAPYGDIIALHPGHCFIPTISSLDVATNDPFYNIAGDPNLLSHTPFDAVYYPASNQEHVTITPENYWWFMGEILDSLPAPHVVVTVSGGHPQLHWSSIPLARSYRVFKTTDLSDWPMSYTSTADTLWTENDIAAGMKFYRVAASLSLPTVAERTNDQIRASK